MMKEQQAIRLLKQMANDYVGDLRGQGHRAAADTLAANANAAFQTLEAGESTQPVPEDVSGSNPD